MDLLRDQGPITRADLAQRLRLSLPTIARIAASLLKQGLIVEREHADSSGGRRPTLLAYNWRASGLIGVYVGRTIIGALADLRGEVLLREAMPTGTGAEAVDNLVAVIRHLQSEAKAMGLPVRAAGVGVPSIVKLDQGTVVYATGIGWRQLPLKCLLEEALGIPVFVENEVNVIALGERWHGAGQGLRNMVCVSIATGIGAGLLLDGKLFRGSHDAAGEIGYMVPDPACLGASHQDLGCLESFAGAAGILRRAADRLARREPSLLTEMTGADVDRLTVDMVLSAARRQDRLASEVVAEAAAYLSVALANLACIVDPERVVISGELAEYGDLFVDQIRSVIAHVVPTVPDIVVSDLHSDAAVLGAVAVAMQYTSDEVFVRSSNA